MLQFHFKQLNERKVQYRQHSNTMDTSFDKQMKARYRQRHKADSNYFETNYFKNYFKKLCRKRK